MLQNFGKTEWQIEENWKKNIRIHLKQSYYFSVLVKRMKPHLIGTYIIGFNSARWFVPGGRLSHSSYVLTYHANLSLCPTHSTPHLNAFLSLPGLWHPAWDYYCSPYPHAPMFTLLEYLQCFWIKLLKKERKGRKKGREGKGGKGREREKDKYSFLIYIVFYLNL